MRIAFCGKGGSGKTTLASLTARHLAHTGRPVLAIDGDINQHFGEALGFPAETIAAQPKLGMDAAVLFDFVKSDNPRILSTTHITESTPAGRGSGIAMFSQSSPLFDHYQREKDGIRFIAVGGHSQEEIGADCFHKFSGKLGIFLNHVIDSKDETIVADMCAGADPFASSGLASRFDAIVLVVEPTIKSTGVYGQCRQYADPFGIRIFVVGNKVESEQDRKFIEEKVGTDLLACFGKSDYVRDLEKGVVRPIEALEADNIAVLDKIMSAVASVDRDWKKYQAVGLQFHKQASESWADVLYGTDMMAQVDPDFSYEDVLNGIDVVQPMRKSA